MLSNDKHVICQEFFLRSRVLTAQSTAHLLSADGSISAGIAEPCYGFLNWLIPGKIALRSPGKSFSASPSNGGLLMFDWVIAVSSRQYFAQRSCTPA
jgi:hypothetical protein